MGTAIVFTTSLRELRTRCIAMPRAWFVTLAHAGHAWANRPPSQEEYMDSSTLEARLQEVARRYVRQTNVAPRAPAQPGSLQPTALSAPEAAQSFQPVHGAPNHFPPQGDNGLAADLLGSQQQRNSPLMNGTGPGPSATFKAETKLEPHPAGFGEFGGMVPSSALGGSALMQNGAPLLIKREHAAQVIRECRSIGITYLNTAAAVAG